MCSAEGRGEGIQRRWEQDELEGMGSLVVFRVGQAWMFSISLYRAREESIDGLILRHCDLHGICMEYDGGDRRA